MKMYLLYCLQKIRSLFVTNSFNDLYIIMCITIRRVLQMNNNNKILPYYRFSSFFDLVPSKELYDRYEVFRDFDDSYRGIDSIISVLNHNSVNIPKEIVTSKRI